MHSVISGHGAYLPSKVVTNKDLEASVETSDEWIVERTGIKQRHIAASNEFSSDLAFHAAKDALSNAKLSADDIDLIVVATTTPDNTFPSTATRVQHLLGMTKGAAFDVQAVCAGFIYALATADKFIRCGDAKHVLVIGAETLSRIVDWKDRGTCILFGDGAGALVLSASQDTSRGILSTHLHSDGSTREILFVNGGAGTEAGFSGKIHMQGKDVFKHAVAKLSDTTLESLNKNKLSVADVDWVVPHQANIRIMEAMAKRLDLPMEKVVTTVAHHANTSAASIPLALHTAASAGKLKKGQLVSLQAIGGGLAWGSCLARW
ncbi:MAG: ketoacyl-ACP synthase III [Proteobacteria bacterium]|nr:ketoacyl-ACP synthase III [Pseudomonadota bacterium]